MPGNEVGDTDQNFFNQESFSQGQGHFEVVERSWPVLNNNLRAGVQRQSGHPFISNRRNANVLQSDANAGNGTSPFHIAHGSNVSQSNLKPGFGDGLFPNQQTPFNGFVQGNCVFPGVQNEPKFSGMDSKPESKGLFILNSQQVKGSEVQRNPSRMLNPEVALNFDFLGAQEQVNSQHSGGLRFLQGQQSNVNDVQMLQQQVFLKQLQDVQRQQLQRQGIWQSSPNQFHSLEKPSMPLNGIPVNDASNYSLQHEFGANNTTHLQRGASAAMQGSPGGLMVPPQHSQGFHVMGTASQHNDHSHYDFSISVSEKRFSRSSKLDNSAMQRMPSSIPSVTDNLFDSSDQACVQNGALIPKQLDNSSYSSVLFNSDVLHLGDSLQRNTSTHLEGRETYIGYTETPGMNTSLSPVPQNEATLDPTEERILFGGDDDIWSAFGMGTAPVAGAFYVADGSGTGLPAGFPSVQSGSWSALMQTALAETSSDNQGAQEEWSGLSVQNVETTIQMSQHNALSEDPGLSTWSNGNMHPLPPSNLPFQLSNNNGSAAVSAISGVRQLDVSPSHGESKKMQADSSPRWQLDKIHLQHDSLEGLPNYANVADSSDSEAKRMMSGSFGQRRNIMNQNNWKVLESKTVGEHLTLKNQGRENFVQKMSSRSPSLANSGSAGPTEKDSKQLPHHHGFDFWKPASSPMNFKGIQDNTNALDAESSGNNDMRERRHESKENFAGTFRKNLANHTPSGTVRENAWLNTGESSNLHEGLHNQSAAGFQKPSARKFQYHHMGNVDTDIESSYGIKQGEAKSMISHDRGYMDHRLLGHAKLVGNADGTPMSSEKFQADLRGTEAAIRGMMGYASDKLSGNGSNKNVQLSHNMLELLHKVDQSREYVVGPHLTSEHSNNNEPETSEGSVVHFQRNQFPTSKGFSLQLAPPSPRLQNINHASPSQNPMETLPGTQPLSSKGVSTSIQSSASLRESPSADCGNSIFSSSGPTTNEIPISNFQGKVSRAFASGFPFPVNQPPNQLDIGARGSVGPLQSMIGSSNQIPGQSDVMDTSHDRAELTQTELESVQGVPSKAKLIISNQTDHGLPQFLTSQSSASVPEQATLSRVLPDAWMGTSHKQHLLNAIPGNSTLGLVSTQPKYINQVEAASSGLQKLENMELQKRGHGPSVSDEPVKMQGLYGKDQTVKEPSSEVAGQTQGTVPGKESLMKPLSDAPLSTSGRQGKFEASDECLRPSNSMGHYSLLHQMQVFKTTNVDHDNPAMKRMKGLSSLESQSVSLEGEKTSDDNNLPGGLPYVHDVDYGLRHFSNRSGKSQGVSGPSPDAVIVSMNNGPYNLMSNKSGSFGGEHSNIVHQMAPPEFEQYGALLNSNKYCMDDARQMTLLKSMQQPVIFHKPAYSVQMQSGTDVHHSAPSFQLKSRKRKIIVPEKLSWHKEVVTGFWGVQEISVAETEWAKSCNRLAVKLDYEREHIEDGTSLKRPRRRLLLTTQLVQLLIRPSPAAFLCGDAVIDVENVVYSTARKTLGDACNLISFFNCIAGTHNDNEKINPEKPEVSEESDEQNLRRAVEYLVDRTRTLTNELSRLDRRYSIADLRAECQDLEKFSIINCFAKFHGGGHVEVVGTPSSSNGAATRLKLCPQRYVTAFPMPRNLPDRIQCLSL